MVPWFQLKIYQNAFGGRAPPGPTDTLTALLQTPQLDLKGPTSKALPPILYPDLGVEAPGKVSGHLRPGIIYSIRFSVCSLLLVSFKFCQYSRVFFAVRHLIIMQWRAKHRQQQ